MACSCSSQETFKVLEYGPAGQTLPVQLPLSEGFKPGMVLNVIVSTTQVTSFTIYDAPRNIIMSIAVSISSNHITINTHHGGWGTQEVFTQLPFKGGVKYCLLIAHQTEGYRIFLNGEEIYFYKHRLHNPATVFDVNHEGKIYFLSYKLGEPKWAIEQPMNVMFSQDFGASGIDTPFNTQLQGKNLLSSIVIIGIINSCADRVAFNLMSSSGETIFHLNPRFTENCVVRNSYIGGAWGKEEKCGEMVFQKKEKFVLAIDIEEKCYITYINGKEYISYKHRKPANIVTKLQISEDIKLFKIIYKK